MENDVLKNKIAPWQETGRWVKITCISDGSTWTIDRGKSDDLFPNMYIASGYYINLASSKIDSYEYKLMDIQVKLYSPVVTAFYLTENYFTIYESSARQNIVLCSAAYYIGTVEVYVFVAMDNQVIPS